MSIETSRCWHENMSCVFHPILNIWDFSNRNIFKWTIVPTHTSQMRENQNMSKLPTTYCTYWQKADGKRISSSTTEIRARLVATSIGSPESVHQYSIVWNIWNNQDEFYEDCYPRHGLSTAILCFHHSLFRNTWRKHLKVSHIYTQKCGNQHEVTLITYLQSINGFKLSQPSGKLPSSVNWVPTRMARMRYPELPQNGHPPSGRILSEILTRKFHTLPIK